MKKAFTQDDASTNNQEITCPHCGKKGNKPTMMRWHFDKCKANKTNKVGETGQRKKRNFQTDMSEYEEYCDFKKNTYFWHSVMIARGNEPQASISKLAIGITK